MRNGEREIRTDRRYMCNGDREIRTDRRYVRNGGRRKSGKLSGRMALIVGFVLALEITVAGSMVLHTDFFRRDPIALVMAFMILYCGVVAMLTDQ